MRRDRAYASAVLSGVYVMNRVVMPRKKIRRDPRYQHYQYFFNGSAIGEIRLPKCHSDRGWRLALRELEVKLFEAAIAKRGVKV